MQMQPKLRDTFLSQARYLAYQERSLLYWCCYNVRKQKTALNGFVANLSPTAAVGNHGIAVMARCLPHHGPCLPCLGTVLPQLPPALGFGPACGLPSLGGRVDKTHPRVAMGPLGGVGRPRQLGDSYRGGLTLWLRAGGAGERSPPCQSWRQAAAPYQFQSPALLVIIHNNRSHDRNRATARAG